MKASASPGPGDDDDGFSLLAAAASTISSRIPSILWNALLILASVPSTALTHESHGM